MQCDKRCRVTRDAVRREMPRHLDMTRDAERCLDILTWREMPRHLDMHQCDKTGISVTRDAVWQCDKRCLDILTQSTCSKHMGLDMLEADGCGHVTRTSSYRHIRRRQSSKTINFKRVMSLIPHMSFCMIIGVQQRVFCHVPLSYLLVKSLYPLNKSLFTSPFIRLALSSLNIS